MSYDQPGQTFNLETHPPSRAVIIKTQDEQGAEHDWWVQDGLMIDLVKLHGQNPGEAATAAVRFGQDHFKAGYPSTLTVRDKRGIPVPRNVDAMGIWGQEEVAAVIVATGEPVRAGSGLRTEPAMQAYSERIIPSLGIPFSEFIAQKKNALRARQ